MEIFDTHRRDLLGFNDYMDLKKPGFGGPASAIPARNERGVPLNKKPKLAKYRRTVERDPAFSHKVYDSTYKAMTHDLVYKQEGKKPFTYPDPYLTAYPTVEVGELDESKVVSFSRFINEERDSISDVEDRLRRYEDYGEELPDDYYGYSPEGDVYQDSNENEPEAEGYGMGPELTDDPNNPFGLSQSEMDKFLSDLGSVEN